MCPPGFNAPGQLLEAMADVGMRFVASARDILSPIKAGASNKMSGIPGVSIIHPEVLPSGLVQIAVNFQATSRPERAIEILELGGLLHIKAHAIKDCLGFVASDGLDALYSNYLDTLLTTIQARYGESLWWTDMGAITDQLMDTAQT